jgi:hypothetical protein
MLARVNPFLHAVVIDGQVAASWKRTIRKAGVLIEVEPHRPLSGAEREAVAHAADAHGRFLGLPTMLSIPTT